MNFLTGFQSFFLIVLLWTVPLVSQEQSALRQSQQTAIAEIIQSSDDIKAVNQAIWRFAEVGLEEHRSSDLLVEKLTTAGFTVKRGISGMPTAFVASYGEGRPIIGILAEYDALPGMSQKTLPQREPLKPGAAGHRRDPARQEPLLCR